MGKDVLDDVTAALEALVDALDREDDLRVILRQVCEQVIVAVPEADIAGVAILRDGRPETVACTDQLVLDVEREQYRLGAGPGMEAASTGKVVHVGGDEAKQRWPEFARAAAEIGVTGYLSAPMMIDSEYVGSLNLYSRCGSGFAEIDAALLELFTTAAEGALRSTRRYIAARRLAEQLREALLSRSVIDQAKGVLMAARGLTAEEAFAELTRQSQRENIKVRDLAARFVSSLTRSAAGRSRPHD